LNKFNLFSHLSKIKFSLCDANLVIKLFRNAFYSILYKFRCLKAFDVRQI
jgi:hypothetical protein